MVRSVKALFKISLSQREREREREGKRELKEKSNSYEQSFYSQMLPCYGESHTTQLTQAHWETKL